MQFREVEEKQFAYGKSLEMIREDLQEKDWEPGAYYCSYPSFMDCSSLLARNGNKAVFLLCILEERGEEPEAAKKRAMWLGKSIQECLRREDIYTRYSRNQYLALLMETEPEDVEPILSRITLMYESLSGSRRKELHYEMRNLNLRQDPGSSMAERTTAAGGAAGCKW